MRILPVFNRLSDSYKKVNAQTQFESKNSTAVQNRAPHLYTGVASVDLAYASMFDNSIAKDLKLMGLI